MACGRTDHSAARGTACGFHHAGRRRGAALWRAGGGKGVGRAWRGRSVLNVLEASERFFPLRGTRHCRDADQVRDFASPPGFSGRDSSSPNLQQRPGDAPLEIAEPSTRSSRTSGSARGCRRSCWRRTRQTARGPTIAQASGSNCGPVRSPERPSAISTLHTR